MTQGVRSFKRRNNNSYDTYYLGAYPQLIEMASSFNLEEEFKIGGNKEVFIQDTWPSSKNKRAVFYPDYNYTNLTQDYPNGFGTGQSEPYTNIYDDPYYKDWLAEIFIDNYERNSEIYEYNQTAQEWQEWEQPPFQITEVYYDNTPEHNVTYTVTVSISTALENYLVTNNNEVIYTIQDLQEKGILVNVEEAADFRFDNGHNISISLYKGTNTLIHTKTVYIRIMESEGVQLIKEVIS